MRAVLVLVALTASAQPNQGIPSEERSALLAIFRATGGDQWQNKTGWGGPAGTECDWFGVHCADNHVDWLNLPENRLVGRIPLEATALTHLSSAWLWANKLTEVPEPWLESEDRGELDLRLWRNPLTEGVSEISIEQNNGALLCSHWMLRIREDAIEQASVKCRNLTASDRKTYCEVKFFDTNGVSDLRKLGRFIEKQGFYKLKRSYSVNQTHAGTTTVRVTRGGGQRLVEDYGYAEPLELFGIESAIWGLAPAEWDRTQKLAQSACDSFFQKGNETLVVGLGFTLLLPPGTSIDYGSLGGGNDVIRDPKGELLTIDSSPTRVALLPDVPLTDVVVNGYPARQRMQKKNGLTTREVIVSETLAVLETRISYRNLSEARAKIADAIINTFEPEQR